MFSAQGTETYCYAVIKAELSKNYWENLLPLELDTASANSAFFLAYQGRAGACGN